MTQKRYKFRVTYEIPPTRAVHTAEFEEFMQGTETIRQMVQDEHPTWRILKIDRGIEQGTQEHAEEDPSTGM